MLQATKTLYKPQKMTISGSVLLWLLSFMLSPLHAHEQCNQCHLETAPNGQQATLIQALPMLCIECHMSRVGGSEHKINFIPEGPIGSLPLVEGKLSCTTCHDPHGKQAKQLRVPSDVLCITCHQF